jgi:hypothetical protein
MIKAIDTEEDCWLGFSGMGFTNVLCLGAVFYFSDVIVLMLKNS